MNASAAAGSPVPGSAIPERAQQARELLARGHACARQGDWACAADAYAAATRIQPDANAWFNLGVARHKRNDFDGAVRALLQAWRVDPLLPDAARGCMGVLAAAVRAGYRWTPPPALALPPDPPHVSVIVCSVDDAKARTIEALYGRLLAGVPHDILVLRDARSLAEAYNRGIAAARGDVVVLSHDDIDIAAADFAARVLAHLQAHDAVGVVGATRLTGPVPVWAGHPYVRGWITHHAPGSPEWQVNVLDPRPVAGGLAVLDGVFLAGRRQAFAAVPFDAATFDGFHGYDVDWSGRAAQAGLRLAAAGDLRIVHASGGSYDETWRRYAERLCEKHAIGGIAPAPSPYYRVSLGSLAEVGAFFDGLAVVSGPEEVVVPAPDEGSQARPAAAPGP